MGAGAGVVVVSSVVGHVFYCSSVSDVGVVAVVAIA